jgi:16S rRNA (guanine527-N7)-methyltransferase
MKELWEKYELKFTPDQISLFENFLTIFKDTNSQINLSSIRDEAEIREKHFIDSIMLTKFCSIEWKVLDLWTWWGFPWIPLCIVDNNNTHFTLIDSIGKKVKVVNEFIEKLWLKNICALQSRAEELWQNKDHRGQYNLVVSRATAFLPTLLEYTIPLLTIWWIFIAYKLDDESEIQESKKALFLLHAEIIDIKKYTLAWQKRILIFCQKIWETLKKYPRMIGEASKNPIK